MAELDWVSIADEAKAIRELNWNNFVTANRLDGEDIPASADAIGRAYAECRLSYDSARLMYDLDEYPEEFRIEPQISEAKIEQSSFKQRVIRAYDAVEATALAENKDLSNPEVAEAILDDLISKGVIAPPYI